MNRMSWFKKERLVFYRAPAVWLVLALLLFSAGWMFWLMVDRYVQLQPAFAALAQPPSVTDHLLVPFVKTVAQLAMLLLAVVAGMSMAKEHSEGTWVHVFHDPKRLVSSKWLATWSVSLFFVALLGVACAGLYAASDLHLPVIYLSLLALLLLFAWLQALGLYLSSLSNQSGMAILLCLVVFSLLWMLGQNQSVAEYGVNWLVLFSPMKHFDWLSSGELSWASVLYFVLGTWVFLNLTVRQVNHSWRGVVSASKHMVITVFLLLAWLLSTVAVARWVDTQSYRLSYADLIPESAKNILQNEQAIEIDVFATEDGVAGERVAEFLAPLLAMMPDVVVNYLDPADQIDLMAQHGISRQGSLLIRQVAEGKSGQFVMKELSYEQWFNGLKKLQTPKNEWLVLMDGFSGGDLHDESVTGYSQWYQSIKNAGYQVAMMSWQDGLNLPSNVKLILLLAPKEEVNEAAVTWMQEQIAKGVSIWWLTEPEFAKKQNQLSLLFDVMPLDSFYAGPLVLRDFPEHATTRDFDRPLDLYQAMTFATASDLVWHNEQGEALAATQILGEARLLVTGDSDFVNNQRLLSGGNMEMSLRLLDWLLGVDDRIDLPTIGLAQSQIHFTKRQVITYSVLMLILLPGLMLLMAVRTWYLTRLGI